MKPEIQELLEKQADWQRSRAEKSWAQKLEESAAMRRDLLDLKKAPPSDDHMRVARVREGMEFKVTLRDIQDAIDEGRP